MAQTTRRILPLAAGIGLVGAIVSVVMARQTSRPAVAPQEQPRRPFPSQQLAALDREVQRRFAEVPVNTFGTTRIAMPNHPFAPHTAREIALIRQLQAQKCNTILSLVAHGGPRRGTVSSVAMSRSKAHLPPRTAQLRAIAQRAFASFKTEPSYVSRLNGWNIVAVPVRASLSACVNCHHAQGDKTLRKGEPIAAALYIYDKNLP